MSEISTLAIYMLLCYSEEIVLRNLSVHTKMKHNWEVLMFIASTSWLSGTECDIYRKEPQQIKNIFNLCVFMYMQI